jgi:NAD(P)-dependent dehydrogenase (short-subunit alcohol dehydrogenase family)
VVATGRDLQKIHQALGMGETLLAVALDVLQPLDATAAVKMAIDRFGRIDVLVNNAGYGHLGIFEESSKEDVQQQFKVNVFGTMDVTRAVLPVMRRQRSGRILNITSIGGLRGSVGGSLYSSTKFALEGLSACLAAELAPFGIHVIAVEPGFFRTDFLDSSSVRYLDNEIADYKEAFSKMRSSQKSRNHKQPGDPAKLAQALLVLAASDTPPLHFLAGTDAVAVMEGVLERDQRELEAWRSLSASTDFSN